MTDPDVDLSKLSIADDDFILPGHDPMVDTIKGVASVVEMLLNNGAPIAFDAEGVNLCRDGKLSLVQLSNGSSTFLIDITKLGEEAFSEGRLRELLESPRVLKVGYDGRADADALFHLYKTKLEPFYDVQIASVKRQDAMQGRRDRYVHGLKKAMGRFLEPGVASELQKLKEKGLRLFAPDLGGSYYVWETRPLNPVLIDYASSDVEVLLDMKNAWERYSPEAKNVEMAKLRIEKAVRARDAAKGRRMAVRDF